MVLTCHQIIISVLSGRCIYSFSYESVDKMADSDSDVALDEEIPINSNHQIIPNSESQWNSNNNHVRHPNRSRHGHHRRDRAAKHHHGHTKTGFSYHDTNEYFELARQARLLSKGEEMPGNTINDPGKHVVLERENEVRDRGKGVGHTGDSRLNCSRFQWNKPFHNRKNKQAVGNHRGEGSSTFDGLSGQRKLVRNGCISPDNVSQFREMSRHNAGTSGHFAGHAVNVDDKGKGKLGLSNCNGAHRSEGGVMLHEPGEVRLVFVSVFWGCLSSLLSFLCVHTCLCVQCRAQSWIFG